MSRLGRDFKPPYTLDGDYVRADILEFIQKFIETFGYSPSFREIGEGCHLSSTSSVSHHLSALRDAGKVEYLDNIARSVRLT